MRVRFVLRSFGGPGGTEKYAADFARWLVARDVELEVVCERADPEACEGLSVRRLRIRKKGWAAERAFFRATRVLERDGFDVVQGFGRTIGHDVFRAGGGAHEAWMEASARTRAGRLLRALSPRERWSAGMDRAAIEAARVVVCNSQMARADVLHHYGVAPEKVRVVRNGVDGERFRVDLARREAAREAWRVPPGGRVALFIGTGFRRKGLFIATEAFARAAGPEDRFVVIGRDSRSGVRLERTRRRLGERAVCMGEVSDPEHWFPGADAAILPTLYDSAANTTLEALSCGIPAVTSARDGNAELVPEPSWVVADPRDADGFGQALHAAWEAGPGLALRCRESAAEWTLARNGTTMLDVYREIRHG